MCSRPEAQTRRGGRTGITVRLKADTTCDWSGFSRTCSGVLAAVLLMAAGVLAQSPKYAVGRTPTDADTRALGVMVAPDGTGLPAGSGTAIQGKSVFASRCASCHGNTGEGGDGPSLVGGRGTLATPTPKKTVGSYWPYATTVWDYVNRAMPFNQPGTLSPDEVYAVAAYVLFLNDIVGEADVLNARSLPQIKMPNRDGFVSDPRPDVPVRRSQ
jgi:S-disulfanyl-L-cysteine oxidoreductase SoxD